MCAESGQDASDPIMNVAMLMTDTEVVGPGVRDALWVQGCSIRCPGCANQDFLEHTPKKLVAVSKLLSIFRCRRGAIEGVSVLGGEPTEQAEAVAVLFEGIHAIGMNTVLYSGRTHEDLLGDKSRSIGRLLSATDLLVDGPFVMAERDAALGWYGSRNQRLILLSPRISLRSESSQPSGEVLLGPDSITLHGVGTRDLVDWLRK